MLIEIPSPILPALKQITLGRVRAKASLKPKAVWGKGETAFPNAYFGVKCEWAAAEALGATMDTELYGAKGDGGSGDFTLPDGRSVQVKGRTRRGYDLAMPSTRHSDCRDDLLVLCWPGDGGDALAADYRLIEIKGFVTRQEFLEKSILVNYGFGMRLALPADELHEIQTLFTT